MIIFQDSLPIFLKKDEIIQKILNNQVVIISGETGSGKSTQIPKMCLCAKRGKKGKIGCTQPRRIAAITIADRIAQELGEEVGKSVGYKIRFDDKTSKDTSIKVMTDGILLSEAQINPNLFEYDTIIIDEAHERSLNIDFILGILKKLLRKRKDLKLIITSATIDTEKFSKAFNNAPIIEVSGKMYPVELRYIPPLKDEDEDELTYIDMAVSYVDKVFYENFSGDILVFMPTEQDIRDTCEILSGRNYQNTNILPLYARLSSLDQSKIFSQTSMRKIIVSTNIAETSITIPNIKYVIDTGLARILQYVPKTRTTSLPIVPISKSSAEQRKGRCGRVQDGICIRLYSEENYNLRPLFTTPEILRANLSEVILRMIALKLGDIKDFPFIDKPLYKNIKDGLDLLLELGAIKNNDKQKYELTEKGKIMARLPIDPRLSSMIICANEEGVLDEICIIASALSVQDPRERPQDKIHAVDKIHSSFTAPSSDFMTLLNIWRQYEEILQKEKTNQLKKFCKNNYLSFKRMREWHDVYEQITEILEESNFFSESKIKLDNYELLYQAIHKSIITGFLSNIAVKKEKNLFQAAKGKEVMIFPGSGQFNKAGEWIVAGEIVETSKIYARITANIESSWLENIGKEQCRYLYFEPHWERNRGEAAAFEQVSLYGLIIVQKRPVSYGRINPHEASEIFIQKALIEGDVKILFPFMKYNNKQIERIEEMENKIRRRELLIDDYTLFKFYQNKLGIIYDIRTLQKKIKENGSDNFLRLKQEDLFKKIPDEKELSLYPDNINLGEQKFFCKYNFSPGDEHDGITVNIPLHVSSSINFDSLDWIVPGLLKEKILNLIKGLPKEYRKKLLPLNQSSELIYANLSKNETSFVYAVDKCIRENFNLEIPITAWNLDSMPDYLKMRIAVTGTKGEELFSGRDKNILKQPIMKDLISDEFEKAKKKWEKTHLTHWDFGDIPEVITLKENSKSSFQAYPAICKGLEEEFLHVDLKLFSNRNEAIYTHKQGVATLFSIHFLNELKFLKKSISLNENIKNQTKYFGGLKAVEKQIFESVVNDLFCKDIRKQKEFESYAKDISPHIYKNGQEKLSLVIPFISAYHQTISAILKIESLNKNNLAVKKLIETIKSELNELVPENFIAIYEQNKLNRIIKYMKAMEIRCQRGVINFEKDSQKSKEVQIFSNKLKNLLKEVTNSTSEEKKKSLEDFFWMIEEYKVSLFAQELKTSFPVSKKRLEEKLKELEKIMLL